MHECMKDAVRMLVGLVEEEEEEEDGQGTVKRRWTMRGGVHSTHTHTHSDRRRRETVAQPGEMWAHLLFGRQGWQHHLAQSSIPPKRVSLRLLTSLIHQPKQWSAPCGWVSTLLLSKTHLRLPSSGSDSRHVQQSPVKFENNNENYWSIDSSPAVSHYHSASTQTRSWTCTSDETVQAVYHQRDCSPRTRLFTSN